MDDGGCNLIGFPSIKEKKTLQKSKDLHFAQFVVKFHFKSFRLAWLERLREFEQTISDLKLREACGASSLRSPLRDLEFRNRGF